MRHLGGQWCAIIQYEMIGEKTIADAVLDRLIHQAHRIELKGESMRKLRKNNIDKI